MKKAFSTLACRNIETAAMINACKQYGLDGVELRLTREEGVPGYESGTEAQLTERLMSNGIVITDLASGLSFSGYNPELLPKFRSTIDLAASMGVKAVRFFLGRFLPDPSGGHPAGNYDDILRSLREISVYAGQRQVEIWLEAHQGVGAGQGMRKLLEAVDSPWVWCIWDVMHFLEDGESVDETWNAIGPYVKHVHLKDGYAKSPEPQSVYHYTLLGQGTVPLGQILALLREHDYSGYVSLEWERPWKKESAP